MKKVTKGTFGYIRYQRKFRFAAAILMLAADLVMFFVARWYFGSVRNVFSIFTVLVVLPVAMLLVNAILFLRAGCCSKKAHDEMKKHADGLYGLYDLYLTSYDRNFQISHLVISGKEIAALTEDAKTDTKKGEAHIRKMLADNGFRGENVHIFSRLSPYLDRVDDLRRQEAQNTPENAPDPERIASVLKAISI